MAGMISITLTKNLLPAIAAKVPGAVRQLVLRAVLDVEGQAKSRAAVDTGAMRNSISGQMTGDTSGEVGVGQEYAIYVEYGTVNAPAQPFMHPAADAVRPSFLAAAAKLAGGL